MMKRAKPGFKKCVVSNAVKLYHSGMSSYGIGSIAGVKSDTVQRYLASRGVKLRNHSEAISVSMRMGNKKGSKRPEISRPLWSERINNRGYVVIKTPRGWELKHRFVMREAIGRNLRLDEVAHHVDGDKANNNIANLRLLKVGEHTTLHCKGRKHTDEAKRKISEAYRKRYLHEKHPSYKAITIESIRRAYRKSGTVKGTAIALGITTRTFYNKLSYYRVARMEL